MKKLDLMSLSSMLRDARQRGLFPAGKVSLFLALVTALAVEAPVYAAPRQDVWSGATSGDWDATTPNWLINSVVGAFADGDAVLFDDTTGVVNVNLTGTVNPAGVTVNNNIGDYTIGGSGSIGGTGGLTKQGYNSLMLNTANTFTGPVSVSQGLLKVGNDSALGATTGATVIAGGATLDVNGKKIGARQISVSGNGLGGTGALINSGGDTYGDSGFGVAKITLTGDTLFGFSSRWDLGDGSTLSTGGKAYSVSFAGAGYHEWAGVAVDPKLKDITIMEGSFGIKNMTSIGDPAGMLNIASGATMTLWGGTGYAKKFSVQPAATIQFYNEAGNLDINLSMEEAANFVSYYNARTFTQPITLNGNVHFQLGDNPVTFANTVSGVGGLYVDNYASGTLVFAARNTYTGDTAIQAGTFILDGVNAGGGALTMSPSTTLAGKGTNAGSTEVGGTLQPGRTASAGTFTSGPLTLDSQGSIVFDVSTNTALSSNDLVVVNGDLTVNSLSSPFVIKALQGQFSPGTYRLINYSGALVGNFSTNLSASGSLIITLQTNVAHQISLNIVGAPANLRWTGANGGSWDTASQNWFDTTKKSGAKFNSFDNVLFDDTASVPTAISLDEVLTPGSITVDSSANAFDFSGMGSISGSASLVKKGSSTLTLRTANDFTGPISIEGGTLVAGANNALGSTTTGSITITNSGTLDVKGNYLGSKTIIASGMGVDGTGAIVNSGGDVYGLAASITLTGDSAFGGNRWDLSSGSTLSTGGKPYNLSINGGYREFTGVNFDPMLGDIDLTGKIGLKDLTSLGNPTKSFIIENGAEADYWSGNGPAKVFHVMPNAWVKFLSGSVFANSFIFEDGANFQMIWGARTFTGPVVLNGLVNVSIGDGACTFTNVISGTGGFRWDWWNNNMVLMASNTYSGVTYIGDGRTVALTGEGSISHSSPIVFGGSDANSTRITVSGRPDQTLTLASGQVLSGVGSVAGNLVVAAGATVTPGTNLVFGGITASSAITLNGTTSLKVDAGSTSSDIVSSGVALKYGGTLTITTLNGTPALGSSYKLFSASSYSGSFDSITPAPGDGLSWDASKLAVDGTISVIAGVTPVAAKITSVVAASGNLIVQGATTNGTAGGTYVVYTQTNVAAPLSTWIPVATNSYGASGVFSNSIAIDPTMPQTFYMILSK